MVKKDQGNVNGAGGIKFLEAPKELEGNTRGLADWYCRIANGIARQKGEYVPAACGSVICRLPGGRAFFKKPGMTTDDIVARMMDLPIKFV